MHFINEIDHLIPKYCSTWLLKIETNEIVATSVRNTLAPREHIANPYFLNISNSSSIHPPSGQSLKQNVFSPSPQLPQYDCHESVHPNSFPLQHWHYNLVSYLLYFPQQEKDQQSTLRFSEGLLLDELQYVSH